MRSNFGSSLARAKRGTPLISATLQQVVFVLPKPLQTRTLYKNGIVARQRSIFILMKTGGEPNYEEVLYRLLRFMNMNVCVFNMNVNKQAFVFLIRKPVYLVALISINRNNYT